MRSLPLPALVLTAVMLLGADGCSKNTSLSGARQALTLNDYDRALANLNAALASDPTNVEALVLKADVLRQQAERAPNPAAKTALIAEMNATARRAYGLDPGDDEVQAVRVSAWAATIAHGNALRRDPSAPPGASVPLFTDAVALLPDSTQGHFDLGVAHYTAGNATAAIAPLRTAVQMDPTDARAAFYLGRVLLDADQGTEAVVALESAADRFPNVPDVVDLLFVAYERMGRGTEALTRYQSQLASATPETEPALRLGYGTALIHADRLDEAITELERAVGLAPDNANAQYNLGAALQRRSAALGAEADAATDNAENARLVAERDVFLERSLPHLLQSRDLTPEGPDQRGACTALFQIYTQLGRIDDAVGVAACAGISMN